MKTDAVKRSDHLLGGATRICAVGAASVLVWVVVFVGQEAWPALSTIALPRFLTDGDWTPSAGRYGLGSMLVGTTLTTVIALAIATPLGIANAIFVRYYAPRGIAGMARRVVELLAGIPSVVFGLWGLVSVVPVILELGRGPGQCLLAAGVVLAVMILPTVALTTDAALGTVSRATRQGAAALGIGRARTALRIGLPVAWPGIRTGLFLATGRALGETMAVLLVAGNAVQVGGLFDSIRTLTGGIALQLEYAEGLHRSVLFVSGLVLMVPIGVLACWAHRKKRGPHG